MRKRKQKKGVHVSFVQPILASILMATSIPLVTLASARTDADVGADSPIFQIYNPRADQSGLFDRVEFRKAHRMRYMDESSSASSVRSSKAASSVSPCADVQEEEGASSSAGTMLRYDDLTDTQKAELRKQLRIGGCPYDVLPGYRELCELMLEQRQSVHPSASLTPLLNPNQERFNENLPKDESR
jgi:hypothetical protein